MEVVKAFWTNYKRSIITFLLGALMAVIYSLTGYKFEVKDVTPLAPVSVESTATVGVVDPVPKAK